MELAVTKRPVVLEAPASASMLTDILARLERIKGRAALWGIQNDPELAALWAGYSIEADFRTGYYRNGFIEGAAPEIIPGWSFSRASTGTARNSAGVISSFTSGVPRRTDLGLLLERASANLLLQSQALHLDPWVGNVIRTGNAGVAPDGAMTATRLEAAVTGGASFNQTFVSTASAGTASGFLKQGSGPTSGNSFLVYNPTTGGVLGRGYIDYSTGALTWLRTDHVNAGLKPTHAEAYANGWWRIHVPISGGMSPGDSISVWPGFDSGDAVAGNWCHAWGWQWEQIIQAPTSYIWTTSAAATRPGDDAQIAGCLAPGGSTVLAQFRRGWRTDEDEAILGTPNMSATEILADIAGSTGYTLTRGVSMSTSPVPAPNTVGRVALTWDDASRWLDFNTSPSVNNAVGGPLDTNLKLGGWSNITRFGGYLQTVMVAPFKATQTQLEAMVG